MNAYKFRFGALRNTAIATLTVVLAATFSLPAPLALAQDQPVEPPPTLFDFVPLSNIQPDPETPEESAAAAVPSAEPAAVTLSPDALNHSMFMPLTYAWDTVPNMADRMGFGTASKRITDYPQIRELRAGWYVDWGVRKTPARPGGIQYVQMVRLHQKLTCPNGTTADRTICPYANPPQYELTVSPETIASVAKQNRGSLWLIGNEMDRMDWEGGNQDEITPQLYAVAYDDLYKLIKGADPTARIAIGGVIQFTPLRKQYLETVLNTYKQKHNNKPMPIDVWNIHNFIGSEYCRIEKVNNVNTRRCYGMGIPAGIDVPYNANKEQKGSYIGEDWRHTDIPSFANQIEQMRLWMFQNGYGNKPLIITEYGVLYPTLCFSNESTQDCKNRLGSHYVDLTNPDVVRDFMIDTFEYFTFANNPAVSLTDNGKLVQRWAWFGLEQVWEFNHNGGLMDNNSRLLTGTGQQYATYTRNNWSLLQMP